MILKYYNNKVKRKNRWYKWYKLSKINKKLISNKFKINNNKKLFQIKILIKILNNIYFPN